MSDEEIDKPPQLGEGIASSSAREMPQQSSTRDWIGDLRIALLVEKVTDPKADEWVQINNVRVDSRTYERARENKSTLFLPAPPLEEDKKNTSFLSALPF